jgi:hypothetical protein
MTPAVIEPAAFRFVTQNLNHCATAVPKNQLIVTLILNNCACTSNIEARLHKHCCCVKAVSITYSVCVFIDLFIHHAKGMRRIKLSSVASPALPSFSHYLINKSFSENVLNKKCVL